MPRLLPALLSGLCGSRLRIVLALATLVHLACVGRLLIVDGGRAPFTALLDPEEAARAHRPVVLMHHKRIPELNATLHELAALSSSSRLRVIVTQTLMPYEASASLATAELLRSLTHLQLDTKHHVLQLPASEVDGSYSVNARRYGTKKNSIRNMLHGLNAAFLPTAGASPDGVIVMEDDIALSRDLLEYFDFSESLIHATRSNPQPQARIIHAPRFHHDARFFRCTPPMPG